MLYGIYFPTMIDRASYYVVSSLIRPLVRVLTFYGISYAEFAEIARWVFVDANENFQTEGHKKMSNDIAAPKRLRDLEID